MTEKDVELKNLIGKILHVDIKENDLPIYGELVDVAPYWIAIKRKDGTNRIISKGRILGLEPTGNNSE